MQSIGQYNIIGEIGQGGMATVYLGSHRTLDRKVAIKMLLPSVVNSDEMRSRILKEAKLQAQLDSHPSIVRIHDCFEEHGNIYLILEYFKSNNLEDVVFKQSGLIPTERALNIYSQLLDAFQYAHVHNVIHRDVKPSNLLLGNNDQAKVVDFGIAKAVGDKSMTKDGQIIGTLPYMSPEQMFDSYSDHRSDIYSLGLTFYNVLCGKIHFYAKNVEELMHFNRYEKPIDPREYYPHIPKHIVSALYKAIEKDPNKRFQSCQEFKEALFKQKIINRKKSTLDPKRVYTKKIKEYINQNRLNQDRNYLSNIRTDLNINRETALYLEYEYLKSKSNNFLTIGRGPNNDIQLFGTKASRNHAELLFTDLGIYIRDKGSTNGTYVDNKEINNVENIKFKQNVNFSDEILDWDHRLIFKALNSLRSIKKKEVKKPRMEPEKKLDKEKNIKKEVKEFEYANPIQRFVASFIDGIVYMVITLFIPNNFGVFLGIIYHLIKDALPFLDGKSIGKAMLGIRVVDENTKLSISNEYTISIMRQIPLIIPFVNIIDSLMVFSSKGKRFGDNWAHTIVIKD